MPRQTPADLADEIRAQRSEWSLGGARLRPALARNARSFAVAIAFSGGAVWSEIALDSRPCREASDAVDALKRSGYEILSVRARPFHARRPLRGLRELNAEVRRLEALSTQPGSLRVFPSRLPRKPGFPGSARPFSMAAFDRLRCTHGWRPEWVSAWRKGKPAFVQAIQWTVDGLCWAFDDGEQRRLDLHVRLFCKESSDVPDPEEVVRLTRAFRDRLEPLGYALIGDRGPKRPLLAMFGKTVPTLSRARRERGVLDHVLFGD